MPPAVRLHEAVALAGRFPLLAGACLEVGEGEVVHLRGPNGAGKTSLLKVLAGFVAGALGRGDRARLGPRRRPACRAARGGHARPRVVPIRGADGGGEPEVCCPSFRGARIVESARRSSSSVSRVASRRFRWHGAPPASGDGPLLPCSSRGVPGCGCSTSRTRALTRTAVIFLTSSSLGHGPLLAPSCSPRTSSSVQRPSRTGLFTWRVAA